jgi:hypothetical protein
MPVVVQAAVSEAAAVQTGSPPLRIIVALLRMVRIVVVPAVLAHAPSVAYHPVTVSRALLR